MNVFVDGRWDDDTGIGRVYREVINRKPEQVNLKILKSNFKLGHPLSPMHLKRKIDATVSDVFYSPSFMPPIKSKIPFVITIHDLNHLYYYSLFHKLYLKYLISYLAAKSKKIITVSHYTKNEIVNKLKIDDTQIEVIYNGVDNSFSLNKESLNLNRPYFLYVGNRRRYKNVIRMLHAFNKANISNDYILALTGNLDDELDREIKSLGISDRIRFLGYLDDNELPKVYRGAYALLFVSLMEGFGLPLLEAMASGTPVITSNISSLPEIAGSAALLVDPFQIESISKGIELIVEDNDLYSTFVALGYERSKLFDWEKCALSTWDVILQ